MKQTQGSESYSERMDKNGSALEKNGSFKLVQK